MLMRRKPDIYCTKQSLVRGLWQGWLRLQGWQYVGKQVRQYARVGFVKAACGHGGGADADAGGNKWFFGSFGMAFLLTVMCALPKAASAAFAGNFIGCRSTRKTWLSVRPERCANRV